jgi:hypothetical protein
MQVVGDLPEALKASERALYEFFRGGVAPDQTLDHAMYDAVGRASAAGWFAGIRIKDALARQKTAAMPSAEFVVRHSIGTDFAVSFARTAYCARLPIE